MRTCRVDGCERDLVARGLCDTHYRRSLRGAVLDTPIKNYGEIVRCAVEGCENVHKARGYCNGHYQQSKNKNQVIPLQMRNKGNPCGVVPCPKPAVSKGLCQTHSRIASGHGLDFEVYVTLMSGVCAICRSRDSLVVDHDHSCCNKRWGCCGKCVRGVLCQACNKGLGFFRDNPAHLQRAVIYLESKNTMLYS